MAAMRINHLPPEILAKILSYLSIKEKFQCERVCHRWRSVVFLSVERLAFDGFDDVFCGYHEHTTSNEKLLSYEVNCSDEAMKCIISKCGMNLRSFAGFVSFKTAKIIAQYCERLLCIDMLFDNTKSLQTLLNAFGSQLTCVTLYSNLRHSITPFLLLSSNLISVAVIQPRFGGIDLSDVSCNTVHLFDYKTDAPALPHSFKSVKNLVMESCVTLETLNRLVLFTKLEMVSIILSHDLNKSSLWRSVMKSWSSLKALSLEVACENCVHFDPLPLNLEFLSLETVGRYNYDYSDSKPIQFPKCLPKLKRLKIYQLEMTPVHLSTLLKSIVCYCPSLEDLSLGFYKGLYDDMDVLLEPVLFLTSLKKLTLGNEFRITDIFASKLITELESLRSIGSFMERSSNYYENMLPGGPLFWKTFREKAVSCASDSFNLIGECKETLHLEKAIPSNVSLFLRRNAKVKLSNGFGRTMQWQQLTDQWSNLNMLKIDIKDANFLLNGIPRSVETLTIRCLNDGEYEDGEYEDGEPLVFSTLLPNLEDLKIYQKFMTNKQLEETVKCFVEFCPNLRNLCIDRGNVDNQPADEQLGCLLNCQVIDHLCLTEKFSISDSFGSRLVNEAKTLCHFGCSEHQVGFQCGELFLKALANKCLTRSNVTLCGGPTKFEVMQILKPLQIPREFAVLPHKHPKPLPQSKGEEGSQAEFEESDCDDLDLFGLFD